MSFVHLHVHSQYSILDGQSSMKALFARASELNMPALAITDHGNLYGVKDFLKQAKKYPDIKPIVGCEVYVSKNDHRIKDRDNRIYYHLVLLAKNYNGYKNLMKIVSLGHLEGMYYRPRVSHEVIEEYAQDLVCCSACLAGEIPRYIRDGDMEGAERAIEWHKKVFGDDYYLEVQLHKTEIPGQSLEVYEEQLIVNKGIFELAAKTNTKVIASNDIHFVRKEDGPAHDRLICLTTNAYVDDPDRLRYTQQEYMKSREEMEELFPDHLEVLDNTLEVAEKIELYSIDRDPILPVFHTDENFMKDIDVYLEKYKDIIDKGKCCSKGIDRGETFRHSVAYLCHLTYEGAKKRYGVNLTEEQKERLDFELKTISKMGYPDYFLIVQDFIAAARAEGVSVGPGRGSAAGSAVAYCLKITNLDPIKYQLLFERFLNPDRISLPDIDIDFDDEGRAIAFKYVEDTYGKNHVSHVVTFGTMGAKSAIRDVARVSRLPIDESNRIAKLIPDRPFSQMEDAEEPFGEHAVLGEGEKLIYKEVEIEDPENPGQKIKVKKPFRKFRKEVSYKVNLKNCYKFVPELKELRENGTDQIKEILDYALKLEGCIRQTGIHACAMIIGRGDLTDYIPISLGQDKATGENVWVSQFDGGHIEDVGMLKMDFLGLKTLSIIKECQENIKKRSGIEFDIEQIPIDDKLTYELYSRGDTTSIFQFESPGMKEWLTKLQPTRFEDLIAMNALYRPGPMDYIPSFVERKQGREPVEYDLPIMRQYLEDTYGVTVYQEQVMLLSQAIAGFTKGEADTLRKAMGKKIFDLLQSLKGKFIEGGMKNGHPKDVLLKIWGDWEKFAQYAFNKSHATCYAWVSYQTAYLKAHYPADFQAANLSKNLSNMDEIKKIMDDCKRNKIKVLSPDINESNARFTVNKGGDIRFGLGGIKGFGENIVRAIITDREENGAYEDIYDFVERMAGTVNRKAFEALLYSGAFDSFGAKRSQYMLYCPNGDAFIDTLLRYGELYKNDTLNDVVSLFGDAEELKPERPILPEFSEEENTIELLHKEKELVGMYLSAHPLDQFSFEIEHFTTCTLDKLDELISTCKVRREKKAVTIAGFISETETLLNRNGRPWSRTIIEDFDGNYEFRLFNRDHETFMSYLRLNSSILIEGTIEERYYKKQDQYGNAIPNPDPQYYFKIRSMMLLGNSTEKFLKGFAFNLSTPMLNPQFRKNLVKLLKQFKGKTPLSMFLYDPQKEWTIEFASRTYRVEVNSDFIAAVEAYKIPYSILKKQG